MPSTIVAAAAAAERIAAVTLGRERAIWEKKEQRMTMEVHTAVKRVRGAV
jgi:hypothetical protein